MRVLGLFGSLSQYTVADIEKAWKKALFTAHPDKGGSKKQCFCVTAARDYLLGFLNSGPNWDDILSCEECWPKHPDTCACQCKTCRCDKPKRDFYIFLRENPCLAVVFDGIQYEYIEQVQAANRRAQVAEDAKKIAKAEAEASRKEAAKAKREAAQAKEEAAEAKEAASGSKQYSDQYYSQLRRELRIGKTDRGIKLTAMMITERLDKLEARHADMAPRYQANDREELDKLVAQWKDVIADASQDINQHTTNEIAGVHQRLDNIEARLTGEIPARREGQSASDRKRELDEILPRLRHERHHLVQEEREEKADKKKRKAA